MNVLILDVWNNRQLVFEDEITKKDIDFVIDQCIGEYLEKMK